MIEIGFPVMENNAGDVEQLRPLLEFEQQYHIHVNPVGIPWTDGWTEIAKFGIYEHGADVSGIGTTWIGSLAAVHALRPFSAQEIHALGGAEVFFEPDWQAGFLPNDPTLRAAPWLGDVMLLYYWEKALKKARLYHPNNRWLSRRRCCSAAVSKPLSTTIPQNIEMIRQADLFANPNQDLDACIHKQRDPLAARLNTTPGN